MHTDKTKLYYTYELRKAAEEGDAQAQYELGDCYFSGYGVQKNYTEAVKWYEKSAKQGNPWGQYNLGVCYFDGFGVKQNRAEAAKWYERSAKQGNPWGQYNLGYCYENGIGVSQDNLEAARWYIKSAKRGIATAQTNLGNCYAYGQGVAQDYVKAVEWYKKAAEQGDKTAQCSLGECYQYGNGVLQDYNEAVKWFKASARQGYVRAKYALGICYYNGTGVKQDYAKAFILIKEAAEKGDESAKETLDQFGDISDEINTLYQEATKLNLLQKIGLDKDENGAAEEGGPNLVKIMDGLTVPIDNADWDETGKIKIDHRSWLKESVYRHIDSETLNEIIVGYIFVCAENEFLRWSDEDAKRAIERTLSIARFVENVPEHSEWTDNAEFEEFALSRLIAIIKSDENLNILDVLHRAEALKTEAELSKNKKRVQVYGRIIYELTECSLKEFESLKEEI